MVMHSPYSVPLLIGEELEKETETGSKYDVLTLHRERDNKCIVRLRGFDNLVFWKEISLSPRFSIFSTPREKILKAQDKAKKKAEQLKWRDMKANHEFDISVR